MVDDGFDAVIERMRVVGAIRVCDTTPEDREEFRKLAEEALRILKERADKREAELVTEALS